ncbi:hypothetical protein [Paraburkholderia phytofirmans]|uniref:Methyltransferase FkbM family n=1 Tax=Paraburkholderia phytofirmans TaxID=261302 RepID=A0ABW9BNK9_9BURK
MDQMQAAGLRVVHRDHVAAGSDYAPDEALVVAQVDVEGREKAEIAAFWRTAATARFTTPTRMLTSSLPSAAGPAWN